MSEIKANIKGKKDPEQSAEESQKLTMTGSQDAQDEKKITDARREGQDEIEYLEINSAEQSTAPRSEQTEASRLEETSGDQEKVIARLESELEAKEKEISELKNQIEELKDKFLRVLADMDNLRKRTAREKEEFKEYALSEVFKELLPIIDNFERALKTPEDTDGKTFREGIELIYRMLINFLARHGVKPIELEDNCFDPAFHHALASEESEEVSEPQIKEELQKGYLIHDRLLRPTMVRVLVPKKN